MGISRIRLGVGVVLCGLAADMLQAPQPLAWALAIAGVFFVVWSLWSTLVLRIARSIPRYGDALAEKLNDIAKWIDGAAATTYDPDVAANLQQLRELGEQLLERHPLGTKWNLLDHDWDANTREWFNAAEDYVRRHMGVSEAYLFHTYYQSGSHDLREELAGKLAKLRLIIGRYLERAK